MKLKSTITNYSCYKQILVLLLVLFGNSFFVSAQELVWDRVFDTGVQEKGYDIATDSYGNIIVVGVIISDYGFIDHIVIKYNPEGDTLWTKRFDVSTDDRAGGVAIDNADNIIAAGATKNDSTGLYEMRIIKYNPEGKLINTWKYAIDGYYMGAVAVAIDSKNNIIVTGGVNSNLGDYITIKYDSSGALQWLREYDNNYRDTAFDIALDSMNNIIITGQSDNNMNYDWSTIKYSPEGDTLWIRRYDVGRDDKAYSVSCDNENNIIVAGRLGEYASIVKYSPYGDTLWMKQYLRDSLDGVFDFVDLAVDSENNLYLAGEYSIWDNGKNWQNYFFAKYNNLGDTLWTYIYDFDHEDEPSSITIDEAKNIIITGTTNSSPENSEENILTIKLKDGLVDVVNNKNSVIQNYILYPNYPNPFNPATTIQYSIPSPVTVSLVIYNLLGEKVTTLVNEQKSAGEHYIIWDASGNPSGVYLLQMEAENYKTTRKLLLLK